MDYLNMTNEIKVQTEYTKLNYNIVKNIYNNNLDE
jgi:hypothetical protein